MPLKYVLLNKKQILFQKKRVPKVSLFDVYDENLRKEVLFPNNFDYVDTFF
ncbi:hypothetical protein SAMN04488104_101193 [Algoriphagus faecimaris]|uniref:Uncharacterized protein n=1 Tax=Algoriphagus faecimaris TaxID=686796 RepID=A0A1G6R5N4_9BACT|nr:hypothetical protein SAMN04488104_101193 [Algoriphagus faecimaris]